MKVIFAGCVLILILGCLVSGQSISSGTVSGSVTDPSGAVVPGAIVKIRNSVTGY